MQHKGIGGRADDRNSLREDKYRRRRLAIVIAGTKGLVIRDLEMHLCDFIGRAADRARRFVADRFNRQRAECPRV